ncbi:MAG: serine/threonine-protein kinase [Planctomycetota bacterium]
MSQSHAEQHPVDELAEDFACRLRRGEDVTLERYVSDHPEWAAEIRALFPTVAALERAKVACAEQPSKSDEFDRPPRQLGDFRLLREIGRGGMGIVYEAEQQSLGRRVAVKLLPRRFLTSDDRLERFRREAQTVAALPHPSIVPVYQVGEEGGWHYLAMQLVDGVGLDVLVRTLRWLDERGNARREGVADAHRCDTLAQCVAEAMLAVDLTESSKSSASDLQQGGSSAIDGDPRAGTISSSHSLDGDASPVADSAAAHLLSQRSGSAGRIEREGTGPNCVDRSSSKIEIGAAYWRNVAHVGRQAAEALDYAHASGTLHRDVKPANLLLDRSGTVWITDFGLAKAIDGSDSRPNVSHAGDLIGTLRYMAPEQLHGQADAQSDVYGLGLSLYELATLQPAFVADSASELVAKIVHERPVAPRRVNRGIPAELEMIILKATESDPAYRYHGASDLSADLSRFIRGETIDAHRSTWRRAVSRWRRSSTLDKTLSAMVVLLSATTLLGLYSFLRAPPFGAATATQNQDQAESGRILLATDASPVDRGDESPSIEDGQDQSTKSSDSPPRRVEETDRSRNSHGGKRRPPPGWRSHRESDLTEDEWRRRRLEKKMWKREMHRLFRESDAK